MPAGPLDRWLQRGGARQPLQPVQAPPQEQAAAIEPRDQQTAEPPASVEQQEQQEQRGPGLGAAAGAKGSLLAFLKPRDDDDEEMPPRKRRHTQRFVHDWQLTGRMEADAAALLRHHHAVAFRERVLLESHAWQRAVLGGAPLSPEEAGAIAFVEFDSHGELLVVGSEEGLLSVHATAAMAAAALQHPPADGAAATTERAAQRQAAAADPLLLLDTHLPKLRAVRWNAADENVVGVASSATRQLHLYDLQHTQGQPKQVLTIPQQSASAALSGSTAVGLTDLAFFGSGISSGSGSGGGYLVLATGMGGQVFLWDARAKAAPSATLAATGTGALYTCQLAPDQQVVLAGSQSGDVKLWDLRGGSSSTMRFGGAVHHHPLLASFNIRFALTGVPGLASQTTIPASAVHSMRLDPADPRRLAFHLGCSWSGVLDLCSGTITHLHAPAHAYADDVAAGEDRAGAAAGPGGAMQMLLSLSTAAPGLHRRACWARDGRFCVPSRRDDSLLLLDFCASEAAGCYALREDAAEPGFPSGSLGGSSSLAGGSGFTRASERHSQSEAAAVPSGAQVQLSQAAICAAAHPTLDLVIAGSLASCMSVVGLGMM